MAKNIYAIMGATGHIGAVVTEELLKKGHTVRAIGRDKAKLQILKDKGAEVFSTSFEDAAALTMAFKGTRAVFSFIPPGYNIDDFERFQGTVSEAISKALTNAKIQHVLNLSSVGAELQEGTGLIKGLYRHEQRLNSIPDLNVLHLRPGFFMENFLFGIPLIQRMGIYGLAVRSDLAIPMVATRDIGFKAAELLNSLKFSGQEVFDFAGPKEITLPYAASVLGKAIGKPDLKYVQFSYADEEKGMLEMGMKPKFVKLMLEMHKAFNEGLISETQTLTEEHKGRTTIEEFAKTFAHVYNQTKMERPVAAHI